jgi:hypothetical protein
MAISQRARVGTLAMSLTICLVADSLPAQEVRESASKVFEFLKTHCHRCHGENGSAEGGLNYVLEYDRLVETGLIDKDDLAASPVLQRVVDGEMPADDLTKPSDSEVQRLREWFEEGAPSFASDGPSRPFYSADKVQESISSYLQSISPRKRIFTRFFVLTHLYNQGIPEDELQTYRNALTKLLNSLSWGRQVIKLASIDDEKTIFPIDLRDLNWTVSLWNQLVMEHPYNLLPQVTGITKRGYGFTVSRKSAGVEVATILPDSPAAENGIQVGDLLLSFNDQPLADVELADFVRMIAEERKATDTFVIERQGKRLTVEATPGLISPPNLAQSNADQTRSRIFSIRGDWFVANASRPPLYHTVLGIPEQILDLENRLGVNVAQDYFQETYLRAGFNGSGVSRNNRLIEQHDSHFGSYWKSFDFASNSNQQNLFANPFGPGKGEKFFVHDGGEMIFTLPNGFQGYMLTDAQGQRIDKGPTSIVSDPQRPDRAVENGISCMSCHAQGLIRKQDQIRNHVEANSQSFSESELYQIRSVYRQDRLDQIFDRDLQRFAQANAEAGIPLSKYEPILMLVKKYEEELTSAAVAAELQIKEAELAELLASDKDILRTVGQIMVPGATLQRGVFESTFKSLTNLSTLRAYDRSLFSHLGQRTESTPFGIFDNAILFSTEALRGAPTLTELAAKGHDVQVITLREPPVEELQDSVNADFANRIEGLRKTLRRVQNSNSEWTLLILDEPLRGNVYMLSSSAKLVPTRVPIFKQLDPLLRSRQYDKALNLFLVEIGKLPSLQSQPNADLKPR